MQNTWHYDRLSKDPGDARHMARLSLRACLSRATFSCVAVGARGPWGGIPARSGAAAPPHTDAPLHMFLCGREERTAIG